MKTQEEKLKKTDYMIDKIDTYNLQGEDLSRVIQAIKENQLKYHQFYNTDLAANEQAFHKYSAKYKDLDDKYWEIKKLNKTYYDIETKFDPQKAPDPIETPFEITSITFYNNITNTSYIYFLKDKSHKFSEIEGLEGIKEIYQECIEENKTYEVKDMKIEFKLFNLEKDLIISFFRKMIDLNTLFLIGFNSKMFDDSYTVNRLVKLIGENQAYSIISDFMVKKYGSFNFEQPDYTRVDILDLYKPVDSGGAGMGKSLPNYRLNTIGEVELGITKLDLEGDFNKEYRDNPLRFATYNLLDVILTFKLDEKLGFLELIYSLSKLNRASVRTSIIGRSFIFAYRNNFHYIYDNNQAIRTHKFNKEVYRNVI